MYNTSTFSPDEWYTNASLLTTEYDASVSGTIGVTDVDSMLKVIRPFRKGHFFNLWPFKLRVKLFTYVSPVIIIGGTAGNILNLAVLLTPEFRHTSFGHILMALALADIGMLNTGLMRQWILALTRHRLDVRSMSLLGCKFHLFFTSFFKYLSSFYLVLLTVERAISVALPLKCKRLCSVKRMLIVKVVMTLFAVIASSPNFLNHSHFDEVTNATKKKYFCGYNHGTRNKITPIWFWGDAFYSSFLPLTVIVIGNTIILVKLRFGSMRSVPDSEATDPEEGRLTSITVMLVSVSIAYIILAVPNSMLFLLYGLDVLPRRTMSDLARTSLTYCITQLMVNLNSAINFVLYSLSGSKFRKALKQLFVRETVQ